MFESSTVHEAIPLSPEHQRCLVNCNTYKKYYWFRRMFERGQCPLCELPEDLFPEIKRWNHWVLCEDLLTGSVGREKTLLIVLSQHEDGCTHTIYSALELHRVNCYLEQYLAGQYYMISARCGQSSSLLNVNTVDTVVGHYHWTVVIPNGSEDVLIPAFKGPVRQMEIAARAEDFARRYEMGEIPT